MGPGIILNCEKCQIGRYRPTTSPYLRWLGDDQIMVIPDVPAHACDICGKTVYDADFLQRLQLLLDQLNNEDKPDKMKPRSMRSDESRAEKPPDGIDSLVS